MKPGALTLSLLIVVGLAAGAAAQNGQGANVIPNPAPPPQSVAEQRAAVANRSFSLGSFRWPTMLPNGRSLPMGASFGVSTIDSRMWSGLSFSSQAASPAEDEFTKGTYRPGGGVTSPKLRSKVVPAYTPEALKARIEGEVWIEAVVDVDGTVERVRVAKSLDKANGLDDAALTATRRWTFDPGLQSGQPVSVMVTLIVEFRMPPRLAMRQAAVR